MILDRGVVYFLESLEEPYTKSPYMVKDRVHLLILISSSNISYFPLKKSKSACLGFRNIFMARNEAYPFLHYK